MARGKITLSKFDIADAIVKSKNWKEVADEIGVCEDVLRRERARHKIPKDFQNAFKALELSDGIVCLTKTDEKKELSSYSNFSELKEKTKELNEDFTDSIGYDKLQYKTDKRCGIVFLTDMHVGNKYTNHQRIVDVVEMIKQYPNIYVINGGDNADAFERYKSGSIEQILSIPEQKEYVKTIIEEIGDRIIAVIQGCHDEWLFNKDEFDLSQYLARHSKGKPLGFGGLIEIKVGKQVYKFYVRHKISGYTQNSTKAALQTFLSRLKIEDVDIVVTGHWHTFRIDKFIRNGKPTIAMICPSFKLTDRWIDRKIMLKSPTNVPMIILGADEKEVMVFNDIEEGLKYL